VNVDLGIVLYPTAKFTFDRFHPSGFPIGILDRLADVPNVVGVKVSSSGPGNALVRPPFLRMPTIVSTTTGSTLLTGCVKMGASACRGVQRLCNIEYSSAGE
jgi:dihydrodipicolinate synthase/N-acetylneuraminate lyase